MKEAAYLQSLYSLGAQIYAPVIDKLFSFDRQGVIEQLDLERSPHQSIKKVLEIGVGTGLNLPYYDDQTQVHGLDFTRPMLNKAKNNNVQPNQFLYQADAGKLPFPERCFDAALTTYVIRVAPNPHEILQEVSRCVKKEGLFVIYDQFSRGYQWIDRFENYLKVPVGWGRNYMIDDLIEQTNWKMIKNIKMTSCLARAFNTRLLQKNQ